MVSFIPQQQFQANAVQREEWSVMVANPIFNRAIVFSLAQMVASGMSPNDLAGVNSFIHTLQNLSEEIPTPKPLPSKPLTSFDTVRPTITATPKT